MSGAIKINGTSSGSTTITAPASGGDESIELSTVLAAKLDVSAYTPGLALITTQSFSGVGSVSLNGCFTSSYSNYRMVYSGNNSGNSVVRIRLRAAGVDDTSSNYEWATWRTSPSTGAVDVGGSGDRWDIMNGEATNSPSQRLDLVFYSPNLAQRTAITHQGVTVVSGVGNMVSVFGGGKHASASAFDGFTFYPSAGTTTGTIRIYGFED